MNRRIVSWLAFLCGVWSVGAIGINIRDRAGTLRPCTYCHELVRTPVGVETPLHRGCEKPYAYQMGEHRTFSFALQREQVMGSETKTQVTGAASTVSGTLAVRNQDLYPGAQATQVYVAAGEIYFIIEDILTVTGWSGPDPQPEEFPPGEEPTNVYAVYIAIAQSGLPGVGQADAVAHEFVYFFGDTAAPWDIERAFSVTTVGRQMWREESLTYGAGRSGTPVFADDCHFADHWHSLDNPLSWAATFGSLSSSGIQTWGGAEWQPLVAPINMVAITFDMAVGLGWNKYAEATNLQWSAADMNFSGYSKTYGTGPPGGTGYKVTGGVGSLELIADSPSGQRSDWAHNEPLIPDFGGVRVFDRKGQAVDALRLAGPWRASLEVPDSLNWSTSP